MCSNTINRLFLIILIFAKFSYLTAQKDDIRNLAVLENELRSGMDSALVSDLNKGDELKLNLNKISDEKQAFLKTFFADYFSKKKITVCLDSAAIVIKIEHFDVEIVYNETTSKLWGVSDNLERRVIIGLNGVIENKKADRLLPLRIDKIYMDKISSGNIRKIESSSYSFTAGRLVKRSSWVSYVEPVVVSISAATIILLFFVLRT